MRLHIGEDLLLLLLRIVRACDWRRADASELGTPAMSRILAISNTAIGDTLLSTPALRSLRLAYPSAHIALLVNEVQYELFSGNPDVDELIAGSGGWRNFWPNIWKLRRRHFDVACIFHGNEPQTTPMCYLSGARFIFKLPNANRFRFLLTNRYPTRTWAEFGHGIDQRLAVAALAGGKRTDKRMTLPVNNATQTRLAKWLDARGVRPDMPIVSFQPGASTSSRRWPASRFVDLGRHLLAHQPRTRLVITGSPIERELALGIAREIDDERVLVTAGALALPLLPALLARSILLVTGDTGPMHIAIAVGTPVVALFAAADWRNSGPAYDLEKHVIIQKPRTCDPCLGKRCPYPEPICMNNISVAEVASAIDLVICRGKK